MIMAPNSILTSEVYPATNDIWSGKSGPQFMDMSLLLRVSCLEGFSIIIPGKIHSQENWQKE